MGAPKTAPRPLMLSEVRTMREMAAAGERCDFIAVAVDRSEKTVRRHCRDLLKGRDFRSAVTVAEIVDSSDLPRDVLARRLGYRNKASLAVVLWRGRRALRGQPQCR